MKSFLVIGACAVAMGAFGCASEATVDANETAAAQSSELGADGVVRCTASSKHVTLGVVPDKNGKASLLAFTPAKDLFALSRKIGPLTTSGPGLTFKASSSSLTLGADLKGKWENDGQTASVSCEKVTGADAASLRAADGLAEYAAEIDGIADAVLEDSSDDHPKAYTVFAVETSRRGSLALGKVVADSAGKLSAQSPDDDGNLDQNDFSYGAMSAAYSLGGGDDYGEWFQGVSDGVSLGGDLLPELGSAGVAGFIAHEKVTALASVVGVQNPSAVEVTVGGWTFFLPDSFAK